MRMLLKLAELLYCGINRARRALYRSGALKQNRLPRPVVSVGNIAMGGGGKTPTVIAIAEALGAAGLKVAILTRGYGGELSSRAGQIVAPPFDPAKYGDEPVLMAQRLPEADVVVGARRWVSGLTYLVQRECDLFLLDDAFQHLRLHRDLDIVLDRPSARWYREGRSALAGADVVLRRVDEKSEDGEGTARLEVSGIRIDGVRQPAGALAGTRVYVVSGLADDAQFVRTVERIGGVVAGSKGFDDHHAYTREEIDAVLREARRLDARPVTSEKDDVKIRDAAFAVVEASMVIPSLDAIVERIVTLVRK